MQTCKQEGKSNPLDNYTGTFPNVRGKAWGDLAWQGKQESFHLYLEAAAVTHLTPLECTCWGCVSPGLWHWDHGSFPVGRELTHISVMLYWKKFPRRLAWKWQQTSEIDMESTRDRESKVSQTPQARCWAFHAHKVQLHPPTAAAYQRRFDGVGKCQPLTVIYHSSSTPG